MAQILNKFLIIALIGTAGMALAHEGVKNAAVKARMDAMAGIGAQTKVLGAMAKGTAPFDRDKAVSAAGGIADGARTALELFRAQETDPKSEARASIWDDFDGFTEQNDQLIRAAEAAEAVEDIDGLRVALGEIGAACSSCHKKYRK